MIHYFKADLFKIQKEQRLTISLGILALLSFLSAFLLHGNEDFTSSLIQLLSQFITLFFIVPANLFFGEDFTYRTINNIIIKQQTRKRVFFYKVLATLVLDLAYILLAYLLSSSVGLLLGDRVDFAVIIQSFIAQTPLFICISLLSILIFVKSNKVNQAYLAFSLMSLLFDNISNLITSNLLHMKLPTDYFLFLSLQQGDHISRLSMGVSFMATILYLYLSYFIFSRKELK
ncbi:TPA: ABC transporter permease [Streptococcus suis]|uniref:ABC transporter permease n=1 Tax=Streptococcus TaxID=1301 RepID=UPI000CF50FC3|nr:MULTISPECIES: ABC transporter permease [Streptococcus]MDW8759067.1 ABC transporter permease [Streptococcus suis]HEM6121633.1 ABC transporter permease [Streptococcus suis]HEM6220607.1 ABC transporter permease [Streptococcus suis]HEM6261341.1 ABC transporter permease [Streptococcus suis]HEM6418932.1 ABC transporter permease [Streptococcus suis]